VLGPAGGQAVVTRPNTGTPVRPDAWVARFANGIALARHIWGNGAVPLARLAMTTLPSP